MKLLDCVLGFRESNTLMGAEMALWVWMRRLVIPAGPDEREQNARPMGVLGPSSLSFSFCLCSCQVFIISCCGVIAFCWCWYKGLAHLMLQLASLKGPQIITIPRIRYWPNHRFSSRVKVRCYTVDLFVTLVRYGGRGWLDSPFHCYWCNLKSEQNIFIVRTFACC